MRPASDPLVRAHRFGRPFLIASFALIGSLESSTRYTSVQSNMSFCGLLTFSTAIILLCSASETAQHGRRLKVLVFSPSVAYSHMAFQGTLADSVVDAGHEVVSIMNAA